MPMFKRKVAIMPKLPAEIEKKVLKNIGFYLDGCPHISSQFKDEITAKIQKDINHLIAEAEEKGRKSAIPTSRRLKSLRDEATPINRLVVEARIEELETFRNYLTAVAMAKNQSKQLEMLYELISKRLARLRND